MAETPKPSGWWTTLPGVLTALTGIITAIAGLLVALHQIGVTVRPLAGEKQAVESRDESVRDDRTEPRGSPPASSGQRTDSKVRTRINPADGLAYVFIPPGNFTMGCSPGDGDTECKSSDQKPPQPGQIPEGFWLGKTEVTQAAWKKINGGSNPSTFKGDQLPVESVNWSDADGYCRTTVAGRLPTEEEWEYAARAGTTGPRYGTIGDVAWYDGNIGPGIWTHPVGLKHPNTFGLYDMLGNVWEWTADDFNAQEKVVRGGSWGDTTGNVQASRRVGYRPTIKYLGLGFRCVGKFR
jgi:formylglycine-generating enzyme required for sulfatase activity